MNDLKLIPVGHIGVLAKLLEEFIKEFDLENKTNSSHILHNMTMSVLSGKGMVFTDNLDDPALYVWCMEQSSMVLASKIYSVVGVYVTPDKRGSKEIVSSMMDTIDDAAKRAGCNIISGGDHLPTKNSSVAKMWEKSGYKLTETFYMKGF